MDHLEERLDALGERFEALAEQLDEAAGELREGQFPNGDLVPSLQETQEQLEEVFEDVSERTKERDVTPPESSYSLPKLKNCLESIREAEEVETRELVENARQVLQAARALRHESDPERLEDVRAQVQEVRERVDDGDEDEAEAVVEGRHPLAMLVAYATRASTLSDDEYETYRDGIEETYGRSLIRDLDLRRIRKEEVPKSEPEIEVVSTAPEEKSSDEETDEPSEEALQMTAGQGASGEEENLQGEKQEKEQASDKEEEAVAQNGSTAVAPQSTSQSSVDTAGQQEKSTQVNNGEEKDEPDTGTEESEPELSEELEAGRESEVAEEPEEEADTDPQLPWTLIREEKAGFAYWSARALEELEPSSPAPPAWLVRASALGPFTRTRDADVVQKLRDDLAQFDRHLSDHKESASCNLLLASATLIPSLLAPYKTSATTYLEKVSVPGGLNAFNRCVADVSEFAASRQRVSPSQFGSAEQTEKQLKHLRDEAQEWKEKAPKRSTRYQEATNVWRKLASEQGPVRNLLDIVTENRTGEAEEARTLIDTLGSDDELEKQWSCPVFVDSQQLAAVNRS